MGVPGTPPGPTEPALPEQWQRATAGSNQQGPGTCGSPQATPLPPAATRCPPHPGHVQGPRKPRVSGFSPTHTHLPTCKRANTRHKVREAQTAEQRPRDGEGGTGQLGFDGSCVGQRWAVARATQRGACSMPLRQALEVAKMVTCVKILHGGGGAAKDTRHVTAVSSESNGDSDVGL